MEGGRRDCRTDGAGLTVIILNGSVPLRESFVSRLDRPPPPWWYKAHNLENHTKPLYHTLRVRCQAVKFVSLKLPTTQGRPEKNIYDQQSVTIDFVVHVYLNGQCPKCMYVCGSLYGDVDMPFVFRPARG